nr:hypothetical protein [Tanacetum cinerariifolium]
MGSQLRLRFEQEAKLLKKSVAQVARREKKIQDRELEMVLLETEAEMKRAAEGKNAELMRELEDIRAQFSGLKAFADVVSAGVAKGMSEGLKHGVEHGHAIAANISRAEKKKKCRIVCRTHGVGSAHHARSDGIPVSVPAVVPQGLALLLVDGATQTDPEENLL